MEEEDKDEEEEDTDEEEEDKDENEEDVDEERGTRMRRKKMMSILEDKRFSEVMKNIRTIT